MHIFVVYNPEFLITYTACNPYISGLTKP